MMLHFKLESTMCLLDLTTRKQPEARVELRVVFSACREFPNYLLAEIPYWPRVKPTDSVRR